MKSLRTAANAWNSIVPQQPELFLPFFSKNFRLFGRERSLHVPGTKEVIDTDPITGPAILPSSFLLQPAAILKAFCVVSTTLLLLHAVIFGTSGLFPATMPGQLLLLSPLAVSGSLILLAYKGKEKKVLFIFTWLLPLLLVSVALYHPPVNYTKVLFVNTLAVLFFYKSTRQKVLKLSFLTSVFVLVQLVQFRYYQSATGNPQKYIFSVEEIMVGVFCLVLFVLLIRIKKEFDNYQAEVSRQHNMLEKRSASLGSLISFSEKQKNKLERTVQLKEKLMSVVSHDIRVPINSFRFIIDNYEKGYITEKMALDGMVEAKRDLLQMDQMVVDLLNWSRKGAETPGTVQAGVEDLQAVVDSVLSIYKLSAKNKNLQLVPVITVPAGTALAISKRELEIIIRNLLSNAIKFSNPGNKIIVSLEMNKDASAAVVKVRDFGKGIHPCILEKINGNRMTSTMGTLNEVGIGIGLSIVFDVINERNLTYTITSEPEQGTEFMIGIPVAA